VVAPSLGGSVGTTDSSPVVLPMTVSRGGLTWDAGVVASPGPGLSLGLDGVVVVCASDVVASWGSSASVSGPVG
jgi:hypothetical protein